MEGDDVVEGRVKACGYTTSSNPNTIPGMDGGMMVSLNCFICSHHSGEGGPIESKEEEECNGRLIFRGWTANHEMAKEIRGVLKLTVSDDCRISISAKN